jgi:ABC-2 type transport system permease protein
VIALLRTEFVKATVRTRTLVMAAGLVGLPIVIALAIHNRAGRNGGNGEGLFRLARQTGLVVPAAVLAAMSGFLLVIVAGTLTGDSVAGDSASGNLRYLLIRPVSRTRLLLAKMAVSGLLVWAATFVVGLAALVAGVVFFGWHPLDVPVSLGSGGIGLGFHLSTADLLWRLLVGTAYVSFGFTALLAIGTLVSTMTDTPSGAVSAAVGAYIVSEILDAITDLGSIRYVLPTHYNTAWQSMFTQNTFSSDLRSGVLVQVVWFVVVGAAAVWWFNRKDIRS